MLRRNGNLSLASSLVNFRFITNALLTTQEARDALNRLAKVSVRRK